MAKARAEDFALMQAAMGGLRAAKANTVLETAHVMIVTRSLDAEWLVRKATDGAPSNSNVLTALDPDSFMWIGFSSTCIILVDMSFLR